MPVVRHRFWQLVTWQALLALCHSVAECQVVVVVMVVDSERGYSRKVNLFHNHILGHVFNCIAEMSLRL